MKKIVLLIAFSLLGVGCDSTRSTQSTISTKTVEAVVTYADSKNVNFAYQVIVENDIQKITLSAKAENANILSDLKSAFYAGNVVTLTYTEICEDATSPSCRTVTGLNGI